MAVRLINASISHTNHIFTNCALPRSPNKKSLIYRKGGWCCGVGGNASVAAPAVCPHSNGSSSSAAARAAILPTF